MKTKSCCDELAEIMNKQLQSREEEILLLESHVDILVHAIKAAMIQLNAPDCPSIPDGAMVKGRLLNAVAKATGEEIV